MPAWTRLPITGSQFARDSARPPHVDTNQKVLSTRTRDRGWAQVWGGPGTDRCNHVATDSKGNVYVTGTFDQTADFDPGPGEDIHSTDGPEIYAIFLVKYDSHGRFQWARTWGGQGDMDTLDWGNGIAVDPSGNVFVTGEFEGSIDFDPGREWIFTRLNLYPEALIIPTLS